LRVQRGLRLKERGCGKTERRKVMAAGLGKMKANSGSRMKTKEQKKLRSRKERWGVKREEAIFSQQGRIEGRQRRFTGM